MTSLRFWSERHLLSSSYAERCLPTEQEIYNYEVRNGTGTFALEDATLEELDAVRKHVVEVHGCPYFVAADRATGKILGYAYAGPYRLRPAYRDTLEDSVYLHPTARGRGIASALLAALIHECEARGFRQMISVVGDTENVASINLHEQHGFKLAGTLVSVGYKFGRFLDTPILQRALGPGDTLPPTRT